MKIYEPEIITLPDGTIQKAAPGHAAGRLEHIGPWVAPVITGVVAVGTTVFTTLAAQKQQEEQQKAMKELQAQQNKAEQLLMGQQSEMQETALAASFELEENTNERYIIIGGSIFAGLIILAILYKLLF